MPFRDRRARRAGFALVAMSAFLLVQPWVVCPATCLTQRGMADMPMSHAQHHGMPCHAGSELRRDLSTLSAPDVMLPARVVRVAPPDQFRPEFAVPAIRRLQQVPASDPPPPRLS